VIKFIKLTRLPFITASIIPFLIGAVYASKTKNISLIDLKLLLGLIAVIFGHLAANIFNDYYDTKSGNDLADKTEHMFFGGSKVIPNDIFTSKQVLISAICCAVICLGAVICLQAMMPNMPIALLGIPVLLIAVFYTMPPVKLIYRGFGELAIFILFGAVPVCAGWTVMTGTLFGINEILLSLPISFLVLAIILCNEVPDHDNDKAYGKNTLIVIFGREKAYLFYAAAIIDSIIALVICTALKILPQTALWIILLYVMYIKSVMIIRRNGKDVEELITASKITITGHLLIGLGMLAVMC